MKRGTESSAFTIIETLIVLAVTGLLLTLIYGISRQQNTVQFNQSIRDFQSSIQETLNNVQSGYYNRTGNFNCTATSSGPTFSPSGGSDNRGENYGCIFIGRVMEFNAASDASNYKIYSVAGNQYSPITSDKVVTNLSDAHPKAIVDSLGGAFDTTETKQINYGLEAKYMYIKSTHTPISAIGFFTNFQTYNVNSELNSGSRTIDLIPITGTFLTDPGNDSTTVSKINALDSSAVRNPAGGVVLCVFDSGTDKYGILTIGSGGRASTVELQIENKATAEATLCN